MTKEKENQKLKTPLSQSSVEGIVIADCPFCKAKARAYFDDKQVDHVMEHEADCWLTINFIHEAAEGFQTFTEIEEVIPWNKGRL